MIQGIPAGGGEGFPAMEIVSHADNDYGWRMARSARLVGSH